MRKSTQNVKHLMLTAVASLLGLTANAQYSQTVNQFPNNDYKAVPASFKLTDVAETLGTDTATLVNALQTWYDKNKDLEKGTWEGEAMFQCNINDKWLPEDASGYNSNFNGMWIGNDGDFHKSGEGAIWHAESAWSTKDNFFKINLYQMKDSLQGGESFNKKFALTYNGKTATFDVTYNIDVPLAIPEPATLRRDEMDTKLTKVGEVTFNVQRTDIQGYDNTVLKFDAKEMAEKLGVDYALFKSADFTKMAYTVLYDSENGGIAGDSLTNNYTAGKPGFWFAPTLYPQGSEHQGEPSSLLGANSYASADKFFIENFKFDGDSISCGLGQYPNMVKKGEKYEAHIYFILGDKYFETNFNIECIEAPTKHLSEMKKVDEINLTFEHNQYEQDYKIHYADLDLKSILEKLGATDTTDIKFLVLKDEDAFYAGGQNAGEYGYYLDADGYRSSWTDDEGVTSPMFVTYEKKEHPERLGSGLFKGLQKNEGTSYKATVYYVYRDNYVAINITNNVVASTRPPQSQWEIVETREINKLVKAENAYLSNKNQTAYSLTNEECEKLLGVKVPMLYCNLADSLQTETDFMVPYTYSNYYCGPTPGVWLGTEGQGHGHTGNAECPVGISWLQKDENGMKAGDFFVFQAPGVWKPGETYKATLYLVNEDTYKMIKLNFNITFVGDINTAETVGTSQVNVVADPNGDAYFDIDLSKAAKALGVTEDELVDDGNDYFRAMSTAGTFTSDVIPSGGFTFGMNGEYDAADNGIFGIAYDPEAKKWVVFINQTLEAETWNVKTAIAFVNDDKQYVYNINVMDQETFTTGIKDVKVNTSKNGKIYNLQGVEVKAPVKGHIYIMNGKKIIK